MEKPMKVMLAEEGSEYGQTCANVLRSYGYEVTLVPKDGSEVISRLPIHTPDVLLMDMFMPVSYTHLIVMTRSRWRCFRIRSRQAIQKC